MGPATEGSTLEKAARTPVVFHGEHLTKTYRMGKVEVHALRSVDIDLYNGGNFVAKESPLKKTWPWSPKLPVTPISPAKALEIVGLANRIDHFPAQLSGGKTTAGCDRPRHRQTPRSPPLRRPYRSPRLPHRQTRPQSPAARQPGIRHHHRPVSLRPRHLGVHR